MEKLDLLELMGKHPDEIAETIKRMDRDGTLQALLPEVKALKGREVINGVGHKDNFLHTLKVISNAHHLSNGDPYMKLVALLHDIGKPATKRFKSGKWTFHGHELEGVRITKRIWKRFGLPKDKLSWVLKVTEFAGRAKETAKTHVTDSGVRRFAKELGNDEQMLSDVICFACSDITTKFKEKEIRYKNAFLRLYDKVHEVWKKDQEAKWRMCVDGNDLMQELDLSPGRKLGQILKTLKDEVKSGELADDRAVILDRARELA